LVYPDNNAGLVARLFNRTREVEPEGVFSAYLARRQSDELGLLSGGRFRPTAISAKVRAPSQGIDAESLQIAVDDEGQVLEFLGGGQRAAGD
jgi:hypothetical protein